ncbi:MAG TPA: nucleotide sugar dehydrogenase [Ktedonobacteraceae bacterium]|nr:nucleotide sugar dehydrogenase [Ktedonobacteraceae bacterium]
MRDILRGEKRMSELLARIEQRNAVVGVIGLGYVGLPLAVAFAQAGFQVIGFDVDSERVTALNKGISPIQDVSSWTLQQVVQTTFQATSDFSRLAEVDTVSICVPTPLQKTKEPDISYVVNATKHIANNLHPGQLVVLESTTYPGTTEELLQPMLEKTGLRVGRDFFLAFSPERIDPGNTQFSLQNTPKVVGGTTEQCTQLAVALYSTIVEQVVQVGSTKVAELVKLLENTYRSVNIGLANEFAQIADILGVDIWEVIEAASSKPFGFVPFYPGPGLGGHCIPLDPYYLSWKLRSLHYRARFIDVANEVNEEMPGFVVNQVALALNEHGKCLKGSRILILGVAYKRDINDVRESPAIDVIEQLHEQHAHVTYADQYVPELRLHHTTLQSQPLSEALLQAVDCVVIVTNHSTVDYAWVVEHSPLVIDTRNATGHIEGAEHVWRLTRPTSVQAAEEQGVLLAS